MSMALMALIFSPDSVVSSRTSGAAGCTVRLTVDVSMGVFALRLPSFGCRCPRTTILPARFPLHLQSHHKQPSTANYAPTTVCHKSAGRLMNSNRFCLRVCVCVCEKRGSWVEETDTMSRAAPVRALVVLGPTWRGVNERSPHRPSAAISVWKWRREQRGEIQSMKQTITR